MVSDLDYVDIKFHVSKKDYRKIEQKNIICINVFSYADDMVYSVYVSNERLENCIDLLLITDENNITSHYMYIKDLNRFIYNKTKHKNKKHFCKYCLRCFSSKKFLQKHKKRFNQI